MTMIHTIASAVAAVGIGAAAAVTGVATQPAVAVAAPVEFCFCTECPRVLGVQELAEHMRTEHPQAWACVTDDKKGPR